MLKEFFFNNFGLILSIFGTLLVAIAIGKHPDQHAGSTKDKKGRDLHIAYVVYPCAFKIGLILIFLGFVFQLKL